MTGGPGEAQSGRWPRAMKTSAAQIGPTRPPEKRASIPHGQNPTKHQSHRTCL